MKAIINGVERPDGCRPVECWVDETGDGHAAFLHRKPTRLLRVTAFHMRYDDGRIETYGEDSGIVRVLNAARRAGYEEWAKSFGQEMGPSLADAMRTRMVEYERMGLIESGPQVELTLRDGAGVIVERGLTDRARTWLARYPWLEARP